MERDAPVTGERHPVGPSVNVRKTPTTDEDTDRPIGRILPS